MINKKIIFLSLLVLPVIAIAQGVNFEKITLEEALVKAKKENKLVFIDFYTVWCGPCKKMEKIVFPLEKVGDFYNKNFINLKLDAEKEGKTVADQYNVTGYPTLLYLDTDGKVLLKDTAFNPEDEFLKSGQRAVASINSRYSLENLKNEYPKRLNDEEFLKMYIVKMKEFGQDLTDPIEAWLKVQTEMEESSPEMKDYVIHNVRNFVVGSKGEQILNENLETYMKNASPYEAKVLPRLNKQILINTKEVAWERHDPELMKAYIEAYQKQPEKRINKEDLIDAQLAYFDMVKDYTAYKELTETYINGLLNEKSIAETQASDAEMYQRYKEAYDKDPVQKRERMLLATKEGLGATKILKEVASKGKGYLDRITSEEEFKKLNKWIEYGYDLREENCFMDDLKAEVYYINGKSKKAVKLKERAIKNWPRRDKKFVNKEYELEQMKKGKSI
ncbi:Thioredoxin [Zhouia amylolytica]|uniref:Thioredoxin n=1 Tax=Zhouia amylolytica TaxID=376730 RepID=A0A1I6VGR7_9FLAO|nr:thioredoxin domain-containing protein [Zhouia amylolytica]SFT12664.1 Thioredoxin [Zhouia amylolytica]